MAFAALLISCNEDPVSSDVDIIVSGAVVPADATVIFIMGRDTTDVSVNSSGYFDLSVPPGKGTFVISADGYSTYTTSPTYTLTGDYDLGTIELSDIPYPISSIYKNSSYTQNSYLFYISFSTEMDPSAKGAVVLNPKFEGSLVWSSNNTTLYFYPVPSFVDTAEFTVRVNTSAVTADGDSLEFRYTETFVPNEARIERSYPTIGATGFSTSGEAYIEFSVVMSDSNIDSAIEVAPDLELSVRVEDDYIYIAPESGLWPPAESCTLSLVDTLYTMTGDPVYTKGYEWYFTTNASTSGGYPTPLSSVYKNSSYSANNYLFYLAFSEEMDTSSKHAVSTEPEIDGSYAWSNGGTQLYFYPVPTFVDTATLTIMIDTTAVSADGDQLEFAFEKTFVASEARISRSYPNSGTYGFSVSQDPYLEFTAVMSDSNIPDAFDISPNVVVDIRVEGEYIYIEPSSGLWPYETPITISLIDTLFTANGVPVYVDNYEWSFTTSEGSSSQSDIPYPVSSIYKASSYSQNSYLFYVRFAVQMDTSSRQAVSTSPHIDGSLIWGENNTYLYFYPVPTFMDTTELTITIDTTAMSVDGDSPAFVYELTYAPNEARITRSYPNSNSVDFGTTREAYLEFSVNMSDVNASGALEVSPDMALDIRVVNNYIYILPSSHSWPAGTEITLSLVDTLYSVNSIPIYVPNYEWTFVTTSSSSGGTQLVELTPDSGAIDFSITGNLYVRTSYPDQISIADVKNGFSVHDSDGISVGGSYNNYSTYFYFYPSGLKLAQWYRATVVVYDSASSAYDTLVNSAFRTEGFSATSIYPANHAVLNRSTDPFQITFNSEVDKLFLIASLDVSTSIEVDYEVSSGNRTVMITPNSGAWRAGREYTLTVDTSALVDMYGNQVENMEAVYHFAAPEVQVVDHSPLHNAINVDTLGNVVLTFNTIMDTTSTTAAFSIQDTSDTDFPGTLSWDWSRTELTFVPDPDPFDAGMTYSVEVDTTAEDTYGVNLSAPFEIEFTAEE